MDTLHLRWNTGEATFEPGATVRIGRDPSSEVQPKNTNVSRRHAEISFVDGLWVMRDVGSAQGIWKQGQKVDTVPIEGTVEVTLGREGRGESLVLEASGTAEPLTTTSDVGSSGRAGDQVPPGGPGTAQPDDGTVVVGGTGERPGGRLRKDEVAGATVINRGAITVQCSGRSSTFPPGRDVTVGRDEHSDVVSDNAAVSRQHAVLRHDDSGWQLVDLGSSGGTYVDGRRVDSHRVSGSLTAWLGDPEIGQRIAISTDGGTRPGAGSSSSGRGGRSALVITAVVVVLVALVAGAAVPASRLLSDGAGDDELARAAVFIDAGDGTGSGTVVDAEQGLILTNAHVVAPSAPGSAVREGTPVEFLDPNPREVQILVSPGMDREAEPRFVGEVVAVDGYLDLAVVRITETVGGRLVEPGSTDLDGLTDVPVLNENVLATGDEIRVFGYPSAAQSESVTLTEGVVSGSVKDERLRTNRGMLNVTADIRPGNSGGLAADADGRLAGVPTLFRVDRSLAELVSAVGSIRPSSFAIPLIEAARAGEPYTSPWIRPLEDESITEWFLSDPGSGAGIEFTCDGVELDPAEAAGALEAGAIGFQFSYTGFSPDEHQDMLAQVLSASGEVLGAAELTSEYPIRWPTEGGCATITVEVDTSDASAEAAALALGPDYVEVQP